MDASDKGQISTAAAEVYEQYFVPALFQPWAKRVADLIEPRAGEAILDLACGTGALAREIAGRVGAAGRVVGLDRNEAMLTIARRAAPHLDWRSGYAEALPFDDSSFDAVVSQFGLMFFEDRPAALKEVLRVLKPSGRFAIAVWGAMEQAPGYAAMARMLERSVGRSAARALEAPFALGSRSEVERLLATAGLTGAELLTISGEARFPSLASWIQTDIRGWTLAESIDEPTFQRLQADAERELRDFVQQDGSVRFSMPAHVIVGSKAAGS